MWCDPREPFGNPRENRRGNPMAHAGWTSLSACLVLSCSGLSAQLTWRFPGAQPVARCGQFAFFDEARGRTTVFQGQDTGSTYKNDCWQLEDPDWIQVSAATPVTPPRGYGAS